MKSASTILYIKRRKYMRTQIRRLSPHQNGKVIGILMAISSLFFVLPMTVMMYFSGPSVDKQGNPVTFEIYFYIIFPILYLILGYIMTALGCVIYNFLFKYIGGIEFETKDENA
jgi:hypothetical protein